jgi:hypothetical protein
MINNKSTSDKTQDNSELMNFNNIISKYNTKHIDHISKKYNFSFKEDKPISTIKGGYSYTVDKENTNKRLSKRKRIRLRKKSMK